MKGLLISDFISRLGGKVGKPDLRLSYCCFLVISGPLSQTHNMRLREDVKRVSIMKILDTSVVSNPNMGVFVRSQNPAMKRADLSSPSFLSFATAH